MVTQPVDVTTSSHVSRKGVPVVVEGTEPSRLLVTALADVERCDIHRWQQLFDADAGAVIPQHPDVVLEATSSVPLGASSRRTPFVVARGEERRWDEAALLVPRVQYLPGALRRIVPWPLGGYGLAGNRLLRRNGFDASASPTTTSLQKTLLHTAANESFRRGGRFLLVEDVEEESELMSQILEAGEGSYRLAFPTGMQERFRLRFPDCPGDYWKQFSSKTRYNFRRSVSQFRDLSIRRATTVEDVEWFLQDAHRISQKSWQARTIGLRIENDAAELAHWTRIASLGGFRSYVLCQGETPAAFALGYQFRGTFYYEEIGYDPDFSAQSPGRVLLIKILEDLIAHETPRVLDFGLGDAEYKRTFATESAKSGNVWILPRSVSSLLLRGVVRGGRNLEAGARNILTRLGWWKSLRRPKGARQARAAVEGTPTAANGRAEAGRAE